MIRSSKEKYYNNLGSKFNNPRTHSKTYWSLPKTLAIGDKLTTTFTEKIKAFNDFK